MKKIAAIQKKTKKESRKVYTDLYSDVGKFIGMKLKFRGVHSLIVNMIADDLRGKSALDIGCGFGRLSFLASRYARHIDAVDMMEQPIRVAGLIKEALGVRNVRFSVLDTEKSIKGLAKYDFIFLSGVIEHMIEVDKTFRNIEKLLRKGGRLIINCPNFYNPRGDIYTAFLKLFDYPMSLTDVRQADLHYMKALAKRYGYEIAKTIGVFYSFSWADGFAGDMKSRMANVFRDVNIRIRPSRKAAFDSWLDQRAHVGRLLLEHLYKTGTMKKIRSYSWFRADKRVLSRYGLPAENVLAYLKDDPSDDPYYCDLHPFNLMGGETVYILRKR